MQLKRDTYLPITSDLIDAVKTFPMAREVHHCGQTFHISPFDIYAVCPSCRAQIKVRSFSAAPELEDLFDAIFEWMTQPGAAELARQRQEVIAADKDDE